MRKGKDPDPVPLTNGIRSPTLEKTAGVGDPGSGFFFHPNPGSRILDSKTKRRKIELVVLPLNVAINFTKL
jgi:hypothetical protein